MDSTDGKSLAFAVQGDWLVELLGAVLRTGVGLATEPVILGFATILGGVGGVAALLSYLRDVRKDR